ncbi:G-type lectin S-receptor-like serine/threonine-protein kinase At2g19130 [Aristolochia californica]|uniref:G-type lectin S-receptor-like serine/threonine-protein kinase At2g19130 n=1 Tax=Aristolochia californica TaxID=171875 RepID=UPI0035D7F52F
MRSFPLFFLLFVFHSSASSSSISTGESLSGNKTITSKAGNFELGFFTPGTSRNFYIGIWYKNISPQTIVWVANRQSPLPDTSSILKLSEDGNLVLMNKTRTQIWSTNITYRAINSTVAELLDSGNFVLQDGSNSSNVVWQSFDYPTDTWLPGAKLGLNKITGENQLLTSWRDWEDPSLGTFSLGIDPQGTNQYLITWNGSRRFWTSGVWNGQFFSLVPEMGSKYIYNFSYVSNDRENYFIYNLFDSSIISRFVMDLSGQIKQFIWLKQSQKWILLWTRPNDQCEVYSVCGSFGVCYSKSLPSCRCVQGFQQRYPKQWNLSDWTGGCVRNKDLQCQKMSSVRGGQPDKFILLSNVRLPTNPQSARASSAEKCKSECLRDCSCTAYAYGIGCSLWKGDMFDLQQLTDVPNNGSDIYIRLSASELPRSNDKEKTVIWITVGSLIGLAALLLIVLFLFWTRRRKQKIQLPGLPEGSPTPFRYKDLQIATRNFSDKLGEGGFGSVFRGTLPDSIDVAVKKLEGLRQGEKQFRTEVSTIGTVRHVNLVRLLGFCSENDKRLLVYEYMPNGSLDSHILQQSKNVVDWETRYKIAIGTARGVAYLHEKCRDCIIHCDIKPENILLDSDFCAKVADFGLAKLMGREFSRVLTTMRGTRGYLAPEWISGQPITPKADVYSYGMMLFEIVSGRRNIEHLDDGNIIFFPTWAADKIIKGEVFGLLDTRLEGKAEAEELIRLSRVACWCIQDDENCRPSMGQVVQILEGVIEVNIPPIPRSLRIFAADIEKLGFLSESSEQSSRQRSDRSRSSQGTTFSTTSFS